MGPAGGKSRRGLGAVLTWKDDRTSSREDSICKELSALLFSPDTMCAGICGRQPV